jgi:hypothetical protein
MTYDELVALSESEAERVRLKALALMPPNAAPHVRKFVAVESVAAAWRRRLAVLESAEDEIDGATEEAQRAAAFIKSHDKLRALVEAAYDAAEAEVSRGREIAKVNATVGVRRTLAAIEEEEARHASASDQSADRPRHDKRMAELNLKAEGALAALSAVE